MLFAFVVLGSFFILPSAYAAEFSFNAPETIAAGQDFHVDLVLDTEMENINAIEGKVSFDKNFLTLKEVKSTDSIISLWMTDPALGTDASFVNFAGITPGGFNSRGGKGKILSLVFNARASGDSILALENSAALLNDGKGTKAAIKIRSSVIAAQALVVEPVPVPVVEDKERPEPLFAEMIKEKSIENNKWLVVFYTQDKNSGISYYEISEQKIGTITDYSQITWQRVQSPYVLADQKRQSFVYIKAVDKAGNATVSVLPPQVAPVVYKTMWFWCIIILVPILFLGGFVWRRKKINL